MATHHHNQLLEEKSSRANHMMVSSSSTGFCYSDAVPNHLGFTHLQNYDSNPEIYNLTSGIEMIGFQPKPPNNNHQNQNLMVSQHHQHQQEMGFMDESTLRPCVFPCEGNERPSQGLSLSLSSSNPSTISLQSFELRNNNNNNNQRFINHFSSTSTNSRDGFVRKLSHQEEEQQQQQQQQQQHQQQQQVYVGKSVVGGNSGSSSSTSMSMQFEMMRNSKYMGPTQELLNEFCNLGTKQNSDDPQKKRLSKWKLDEGVDNNDHHHLNHNVNDDNNASSSTSRNVNPSLYGVSVLELQKRKTKLLGMLEELDRRYKHYCEQMKGVVCSFEAVAGPGAANVYSALASKAMSRHFRCLRDSIVAQIMATKKAMGEKDSNNNNNATILGTTKGETPRLRILDQNLRQQRAYQQMTMMETHPWRPQRGLPERSVSILRAWLFEHFLHPYPSDVDKHILARQTGLSRSQVSNWFINARVRLWKPMVEQMYLEETKEEQDKTYMGSSSDDHQPSTDHFGGLIQPPPPPPPVQEQKPNHDQLLRIDQDSLSSIVNTTTTTTATSSRDDQNRIMMSNNNLHLQQSGQFISRVQQQHVEGTTFGSMDHLNFASSSSYNQHQQASTYGTTITQNDNNTPHQGFSRGNNNNVSLTLGLQQHGGNGVSLAFSPASHTSSLFYARDHIDDCQQVHHQFSLMDGDQAQNNLPYRNLMGAQVLHDFA
ncbi:Homeobox protein BEL1-like protein [Bienertia sinuspersici]